MSVFNMVVVDFMLDGALYSCMTSMATSIFAELRPLIPMYIHLLLSATLPIIAGTHASLTRPASAAKPGKKRKGKPSADDSDDDDESDEEEEHQMEGLTPRDAIVLPITAGITLASLYWVIKTYGAGVLNAILAWYFSFIGVFSVGALLNDSFLFLLGPTYRLKLPRYRTKLHIHALVDASTSLTVINVIAALMGVASIVFANISAEKVWWLTNLQGHAVSYSALQLLSPTTFATGSLILGGLFFYDIWAVFKTSMMITVAKHLDQPIKLVFPRPGEPGQAKTYSMLGLGDVVLPGLIIGLALRFDLHNFYLRKQHSTPSHNLEKATYIRPSGRWASFPKPYFRASMVGYVFGMLTTLGVMAVFNHAQPALLYLVPGVLVSLWGTALVRGELRQMWEYTEAVTGAALDEDVKDTSKGQEKEKVKEKDTDAETKTPKLLETEGERTKGEKKAGGKRDTLISFSVVRRRRARGEGYTEEDTDELTEKNKVA